MSQENYCITCRQRHPECNRKGEAFGSLGEIIYSERKELLIRGAMIAENMDEEKSSRMMCSDTLEAVAKKLKEYADVRSTAIIEYDLLEDKRKSLQQEAKRDELLLQVEIIRAMKGTKFP